MHYSDFQHFRDLLVARQQHLISWLGSMDGRKGGEEQKVRRLLRQIKEALERIERETFGVCKICHGSIEEETLELRPESEVCNECLNGEEKEVFDDDLRMAGKIQRALLPQSLPDIPGFSIAARWLPANEVGGDFYDFLPCGGDQQSRIIIADAMGKGVAAGIVMSSLHGALRVLSSDTHSPGRLLTRLNQWLCRNVPVTKFVSLACLCLERTGEAKTALTYANAGHCLPILARADGSVERLEITGGVLGVHEDFTYEEQKLSLSRGDFLMLYTDGVTELRNHQEDMFDDSRLIDFIRAHRDDPIETIIDKLIADLKEFSGVSGAIDDDVTIVILRKL